MSWTFLDHPTPFGFAHQGGTDVAPGNTEAAFRHAVALGYEHLETDVQATADGVLVVFHDDDLGALTGTPGRIEDLTWSALSELRVGGEHPIPRFEDLVELFPGVRFNVEPKTDAAVDPLISLIRRRGLEDRVCVGSFSDRRLRRFRRRLGPPPVCTSPGPIGVLAVMVAALVGRPRLGSRHGAVQIPPSFHRISLTSGWLVRRIHRLDLQVHVWTINDEAEMERLLDNGVDAIMTDRVVTLKEVLTRRGGWPGGTGPGAV
jgi:glycerophosphoryl diester phosphodiesterase